MLHCLEALLSNRRRTYPTVNRINQQVSKGTENYEETRA
jgi:hypothetical protein